MQLHSELKPSSASERGARRHVRHVYSVPITLRHLGLDRVRVTHGVTLDISEGGFAAVVEENLRTGETVRLDLPLAAFSLDTLAVVRYVSSSRSGFEFLNLNAQARQQIAAAAALYKS